MDRKKLPVSPFDYQNFRLFLVDLTVRWKKDNRRWNFAAFSRETGFSSPNYLKQIIEGKRNLAKSAAEKITAYFGFNRKETSYFYALVDFNQAKTDTEKESAFLRMQQFQKISSEKKNALDFHRFYSEWYNPVIRELVLVEGFTPDPQWVSERVMPKISEQEADRALKFLVGSGQLTQDESGRVVQTDPVNTTGEEIASLAVANYHRSMMNLAAESLERLPADQRNISSLTMALSRPVYEKIVEEIYQFQDRIIQMASSDSSAEGVYQLNFQLFPTTQIQSGGKK